jgi:hypothetical protein
MDFKKYKPIFTVFSISIAAFVAHKIAFYLFADQYLETSFSYSLLLLYVGFCISSVLLLLILIIINQTNIDNVGYTFLLLTSIKAAVAYFFSQPILNSTLPTAGLEKTNFFIVFMLFLAIETIVTIGILNNKQ